MLEEVVLGEQLERALPEPVLAALDRGSVSARSRSSSSGSNAGSTSTSLNRSSAARARRSALEREPEAAAACERIDVAARLSTARANRPRAASVHAATSR